MPDCQSAMPQLSRVLVLDTNTARAEELSNRLRCLNYEPVLPKPGQDLAEITDDSGIAVMLGDMGPGQGVWRAFRALSKKQPTLPVLRMSGTVLSAAMDAQLHGHSTWDLDFPLKQSQLSHLLSRAKRYQGMERRVRLTGNSKSIRDVRKLIEQVADFDTTVLITGDSGTGKELVARTVHDLSRRGDKPFVPINCGAIPEALLESELFGHEKGAFTGALSARKGRFELAEGGTLFLDEIGDMSPPMQAKLLRVLQERSYERVGSNQTRHCNVRIVAATHRDLPDAVSTGKFREDLYYRLNVFPIQMPPLYKRVSDLPALLDEFRIQHRGEGEGGLRLSEDAMRALARYSWPGNIRELSNLVERLSILHPAGEVSLADLPKKYRDAPPPDRAPGTLSSATEVGIGDINLKEYLQKIEKKLITKAMQASAGVVANATRLLSLRRTTLVEKLGKYSVKVINSS